MKNPIFLFFLLQILAHFPSIFAVEYDAVNAARETPGGHRFDAEIGIPYTKLIMKTINYFIWDILQQYSESNRKNVPVVKLFIHQFDGAEAVTYGEMINVSAIYLAGYQGNLKWEYTSLLHHEMTHVFQWNGEGHTPVGLVEGIADYMILKSG
ncbi:UNVERIFIED_CONTAM: hypothetical protein Sradi_4703300 [Sesamum radiatum]|uniref:Uncharacterized protein n=1 Tax=Sesamum radiatum TaxID=300843 RepID=A0AAW2MVU1_SESRA